MTSEQEKAALQELADSAQEYQKVLDDMTREEEDYWVMLTREQQLIAFCAVVRRLKKGELDDQRSYRGVLYDTFGFGMESYVRALNAGFMDLHNSIVVDDNK